MCQRETRLHYRRDMTLVFIAACVRPHIRAIYLTAAGDNYRRDSIRRSETLSDNALRENSSHCAIIIDIAACTITIRAPEQRNGDLPRYVFDVTHITRLFGGR